MNWPFRRRVPATTAVKTTGKVTVESFEPIDIGPLWMTDMVHFNYTAQIPAHAFFDAEVYRAMRADLLLKFGLHLDQIHLDASKRP